MLLRLFAVSPPLLYPRSNLHLIITSLITLQSLTWTSQFLGRLLGHGQDGQKNNNCGVVVRSCLRKLTRPLLLCSACVLPCTCFPILSHRIGAPSRTNAFQQLGCWVVNHHHTLAISLMRRAARRHKYPKHELETRLSQQCDPLRADKSCRHLHAS